MGVTVHASSFLVMVAVLLSAGTVSESPSLRSRPSTTTNTKSTKLLLLLFDGLRWDEVREDRPGMKLLMDHGVHAKHLTPCFPSSSMPNYMCILTGQYTEDHGMIGNEMYDNSTGEVFQAFAEENDTVLNEPKWWQDVHPIWVDAINQGKRVRLYSWPDCHIPAQNVSLKVGDQCIMYREGLKTSDLQGYVNQALTALAEDKLDFAAIYYDDPDDLQHKYGVQTGPVEKVITELDGVLEDLQHKAETLTIYNSDTKLIEKLNIMVVSDHGHMNFTGSVNVTGVFARYPANVKVTGQQLHVWPKGNAEQIFTELSKISNMTVYHQDDIPDRWHIKRGRYMSPILAVADLGYYFISPDQKSLPTRPLTGPIVASHGWDNALPQMQASFLARGPNFTQGGHTEPIANIELYQIMCAVLGLRPAPNRGHWSHVQPLVVGLEPYRDPPVSFMSVVVTVVVALSVVLVLTVAICGVHHLKQRARTKQYRTLPTMMDSELDNDELGL